MSDKLLEKIVNNQVTIARLMNTQQADLHNFLYRHKKKREDDLASKMQVIIDAIRDLKESVATSSIHTTLTHSAPQPINTVPLIAETTDPSISRSKRPRGLCRLKKTCYMNSVLQALAAVDPHKLVQESGVALGKATPINRTLDRPDNYQRVIALALEGQLNLMWEFIDILKLLRSKGPPAAVIPYAFQFTFSRLLGKQDYDGAEEQDAALFFGDFLSYLHEHQPDYSNIIDRLFRIHSSSLVRCSKTSEVKGLTEDSWCYSLKPLPHLETTTVGQVGGEDAHLEVRVRRLMEYNLTYQDGCVFSHENCTHEKTLRYLKPLPDFLILKFWRHKVVEGKWEWKAGEKVAYKVLFDEDDYTIDLSDHVEPDGSEKSRYIYKLRTLIYHFGTFEKGHYFSVSRTDEDGSNDWWQCDDAHVRSDLTGPDPVGEFTNSQAYMALYERVYTIKPTVERHYQNEHGDEHEGDMCSAESASQLPESEDSAIPELFRALHLED
ncbi:cysteine proteinase [Karstenula rhodostoma CBS 690.94]|uniref:ubiquitinyl hydrolase 1 n=1 Tax=Karstenula rhodostoma CBS 690.94 TaxID=1392251 RepID=A0A9P4U8X2_9PLEO|nr:cysteine proteinase [Karstenula rhodostoma CBS 690.94]